MRNDIGFKVDAGFQERDEDGRVVCRGGGPGSMIGGGAIWSPCSGARAAGGGKWGPGRMGACESAD